MLFVDVLHSACHSRSAFAIACCSSGLLDIAWTGSICACNSLKQHSRGRIQVDKAVNMLNQIE